MKKVKIILTLAFAMAFINISIAQQSDEKQMEQDIEVMESILNELFGGEDNSHFHHNSVSGNYLPGYGVIFRVPRNTSNIIFRDSNTSIAKIVGGQNTAYTIRENEEKLKNEVDSIVAFNAQKYAESYQDFFINYGDLMSGLKQGEKILIIHGKGKNSDPLIFPARKDDQGQFYAITTLKRGYHAKTTAQVPYDDVIAFSSGKMSEDQFKKKILIHEDSGNKTDNKEFEILGNIFERIYKDNDNWLHLGGEITYEKIDGLGAIYEMGAHTLLARASRINLQKRQNVGVLGKAQSAENVERKTKQDVKAENLLKYHEFVENLKSNLIKYGKTLKSLSNEELLMLSVDMPNCYSCENPEKINLIVKAAVLKAYGQRKISLAQAIEKVELKEIR